MIFRALFLQLPRSICKNIDSQFQRFWSGYKKDSLRNLSLHYWSKICSPRSGGGMGIKLIYEMNLTLLSKLGWMLTTSNQCPWVKCLQAKYLKRIDFMQVEWKASFSWIWNGLLQSRPIITQARCYLVVEPLGPGPSIFSPLVLVRIL